MAVLSKDKIMLDVSVSNKTEAIRLVGQMLVDAGHVPVEYIDYMILREADLSTYMGAELAIPHGTNEAKKLVLSTGLAVAILPEGVEFDDGNKARLVVGIAAIGDEHMDLLTSIAIIVSDDEIRNRLLNTTSKDEVMAIFQEGVQQ